MSKWRLTGGLVAAGAAVLGITLALPSPFRARASEPRAVEGEGFAAAGGAGEGTGAEAGKNAAAKGAENAATKPGAMAAKNAGGKRKVREITGGTLEDNLTLLNQWGRQSEAVSAVYAAAYKVLAAKPSATYADLAGDEAFQRLCKANGIEHLGGPMLGAIAADGAKVWVRTVRPAEVEVRVSVEGVEKAFGPVKSTAESDLTAVVPVAGLAPLTRNPYRVLVDGKDIPMPAGAAIATAPAGDRPSAVRIAFGSCYHRWGLGNQRLADLIRSRGPAAMLLYGDIAVQDRRKHVGLHRADYLLRDFMPAWRSMAASVPVFATWDDHDYFSNDAAGLAGGTKADQAAVREAFLRAWNNPAYGFGDQRGGVFLRTRVGPCDVIMVDNRYFRPGKTGGFLGEDQMKWLEARLLECRGPFIIISCGTMWSDYVSDGKDSWGKCDPAGRERIFRHIETNRIAGVLLVSGDRHGARVFRIPRPGGFSLYEFEPASLGGRGGAPVRNPAWTTQLFGVAGVYAFGEFTIDPAPADPTVTFRLIAEDGRTLYETRLTRSQLTPPGLLGTIPGAGIHAASGVGAHVAQPDRFRPDTSAGRRFGPAPCEDGGAAAAL